MQIIINQKEIEKAIKLYLANTVMVRNLSEVTIDLIATRSGEGVKATIDFCNEKEADPSNLVQEEPHPKEFQPKESQDENPEPEPEKEPEKEEPHPRRTSLFAGMTKPVNKES